MKTKTYILPTNATNLEEADSEEQETDICIICQVWILASCFIQYFIFSIDPANALLFEIIFLWTLRY